MAKVPDDLLYKKSFSVRFVDYYGDAVIKEYDKPVIKKGYHPTYENYQGVQALICAMAPVVKEEKKGFIDIEAVAELTGLSIVRIGLLATSQGCIAKPRFPHPIRLKGTLLFEKEKILDWIEADKAYNNKQTKKTIIRRTKKCDQN